MRGEIYVVQFCKPRAAPGHANPLVEHKQLHYIISGGCGAARRRSKALSASADVSQGTKVAQQHGVQVRDRLRDDQAGDYPGFSDFEHPLR